MTWKCIGWLRFHCDRHRPGQLAGRLQHQAKTVRSTLRILPSTAFSLMEHYILQTHCFVAAQGQPVDLEAFSNHLANNYIPNTVIVDCTASSEWLGAGLRCLHVGSSALSDRPRPAAPPVSVLPLVQLAIGRPADWFGAPHFPASQTSLASGTWSGCARASTSSPPTRSSTGAAARVVQLAARCSALACTAPSSHPQYSSTLQSPV